MGTELKKRCAVISGAPETQLEYIRKYCADSYIIAADSGYLKCEALGITPDLIVGDFDSAPVPRTKSELIISSPHKDDTDTLMALKEAIARGYKSIVLLGAIGGRFDHSFSNVVNMDYCRRAGVDCKIVCANAELFIAGKPFQIKKGRYDYFSLFAFGGACTGLTIQGAAYPLHNYLLECSASICQSNEVRDAVCSVSFTSGNLLVVLSNDFDPRA